ncbi:MAG: hypothetical protein ACE366_30805 [Bradymonadia bacterium]
MPYEFYKVLHLVGIFMIFTGLGGAALAGTAGLGKDHPWRKPLAMTHGLGLLIALTGGFGLLARLQFTGWPWPGWAVFKLVIWLVLGGLLVVARKRTGGRVVWWLAVALGGTAAYLAVYKPFHNLFG